MTSFRVTMEVLVDVTPEDLWDTTLRELVCIHDAEMVSVEEY